MNDPIATGLRDALDGHYREIREEFRGKAGAPPHVVKMNLNIKDCPDGVGTGGVASPVGGSKR